MNRKRSYGLGVDGPGYIAIVVCISLCFVRNTPKHVTSETGETEALGREARHDEADAAAMAPGSQTTNSLANETSTTIV